MFSDIHTKTRIQGLPAEYWRARCSLLFISKVGGFNAGPLDSIFNHSKCKIWHPLASIHWWMEDRVEWGGGAAVLITQTSPSLLPDESSYRCHLNLIWIHTNSIFLWVSETWNILTTSLKNMCARWFKKQKKTFLLEMLKWHIYWQHMLVIRAHVFCSDGRVCTQTEKKSKLTTSRGARSELHSGSHQFLSSSGTSCYELSEQIGPEQEVRTGDPEPFSHQPSSHAASCSDSGAELQRTLACQIQRW